MNYFSNVTVDKTANIYFDGKVTSRKLTFTDGTVKTLGIMMPGEYRFSAELAEIMEITSGEVQVLLPNSKQWQTFSAGEYFNVPAFASFDINVLTLTDYCCSYVNE